MNRIKALFTREVRKYVYSLGLAVGLALVGFGVLPVPALALLLPVLLALLNLTPKDVG